MNEALSRTTTPVRDAIELFNPSSQPAELGGWFLTDNSNEPKKYRIPDGTIIPSTGFLVFTEEEFNDNNPGTPFALSTQGEEVFLFSAIQTAS